MATPGVKDVLGLADEAKEQGIELNELFMRLTGGNLQDWANVWSAIRAGHIKEGSDEYNRFVEGFAPLTEALQSALNENSIS